MNPPNQPAAPTAPGASATPKLNHLNLCTSDVVALSDLFTRHFGFAGEPATTDSALLHGSDGFLLVLTKIAEPSPPTYPHSLLGNFRVSFHVGFMLETSAQVHAKHQELREDGWQPGPLKTFEALGATWTAFYCPLGDGIDVEVNAHVGIVG